jgi:3-oxoadipate enol-lactonase
MEHTLALPHGLLCWQESGSRDATTVIVLLHGFPHDRGLWQAQLASHADALPGTRLLVPDLPGFGGSTPLADSDMDGYADVIAAMLDEAGVRRAVIAGLSMGGYITFSFWRRHAARVQALVLLDTKAPADTEAARDKRRELITTVEAEGVGAIVPALLAQQLGVSTRDSQPALVSHVEVMLRRAPASGVIGAARAMMQRPDSTPTLETITVPTLVLVGEEDTVTPASDAIAIQSGIRGSRLVTVPGAGHLAPLEQPTIVNAAIAEFLDVVM